jgi:hypothetical protein
MFAARRIIMSEPLKGFASLSWAKVAGQTNQKLVESYLELQKLRQQVRIAQCGRATVIPATHDLPPGILKH